MRSLVGLSRTGRVQKGPGSDLVEMQGPDGARHTAIEFHAEYRDHNAINAALGVVLSFLESPMVSGLADLGAYDLAASTFVYPTGQVWSVAEVVRTLADLGEVGGVRAGVELLANAGQVLVEAAETGESAGVYSHGGLTPWRVVLDAEGRLQVIGHALPQVEILSFHEHPERIPREDAFRYCPPERMEARRENFSSDLFGLALIAFEVMCGKPVYDGLVNDIRAKAARGETSRRIHQFREFLPESVRTLLTTALRPDFRDRYGAGGEFLDAVQAALGDPDVQGVGLRDMMQRVIRQQPRARQELDPAKTSMLSKDALQRMMEEDEGAASRPQRATFSPPVRPAAAPPARPAAAAMPPSPAPAAGPPAASSGPPDAAPSPRVGLPPARRPPVRAPGVASEEDLGGPAAAPAPTPPAGASGGALPAGSSPGASAGASYGPPLRSGARPNPRLAAAASESPAAAAPPPASTPAEPLGDAGRPAVGVARLPPSRRPPGAEPGPPAPPSAPPESPASLGGEAPGRRPPAPPSLDSGDRARELLARVRASGSSDAFPRATPSAAQVIDRILTSSGSGQALRDRMARAQPAVPAEPPPSEPTVPARAAAPPSEPTVPARAAAPPLASVPPARPPVEAAPSEDAGAPPPRSAGEGRAAPVAAPAPSGVAAAPTPTGAPAASGSSVAAGTVASLTERLRASAARVPDALRSGLRGDPVPCTLARGPAAPPQRRRIPAQSALSDVAGLLVGQVVPLRTSLEGRLTGWWRLGPAEGPLSADTRLDSLAADTVLIFHFVESEVVPADIEVHAPSGPVRLRTPVGTGVPVQTLLDSIATLLDLPAGEWTLLYEGQPLDPYHILSDRGFRAGETLVARRA